MTSFSNEDGWVITTSFSCLAAATVRSHSVCQLSLALPAAPGFAAGCGAAAASADGAAVGGAAEGCAAGAQARS